MNWIFSNVSTPFIVYNLCRYLLSFIAKDDTDEAQFFAYDDEASKIIQEDCQALVKPLHIKEGLPQAMHNILNKTCVVSWSYQRIVQKYEKKAVPSQSSSRQATEAAFAADHGNISVSPTSHNKLNTNH